MPTTSLNFNPLIVAILIAILPVFQPAIAAEAMNAGVTSQQLKPLKKAGTVTSPVLVVKAVNKKMIPATKSVPVAGIVDNPMTNLTQPNQPILVRKIQIVGANNISATSLHNLVADSEGKTLTLIQLRERISVISDYYYSQGLTNTFAIIPGQLVKNGVVEVQIIKMQDASNKGYESVDRSDDQATIAVDDPTGVNVSRPVLQLVPASTAFMVQSLRITGNVKVKTSTLHALVADSEGKLLSIIDIRQSITRINDYYNAHGYPNSRAIIPIQVIRDGVVEIQIIAQRRMTFKGRQRIVPVPVASPAIYEVVETPVPPITVVTAPVVESNDFLLNGFIITGNKNIATPVLLALVADGLGKKINLEQLQILVSRMTDYYHSRAFPLARAVIPPQTINDGLVHVVIYEAYYGKVSVNNHSRVKTSLFEGTVSSLKPGDVIVQPPLDHALLLLSDIPGAIINAVLQPGEFVGTADLIINTLPSPRVYGNLVLDNYGNSYTGKARLGASANVIDPFSFGLGDTLSLSGLSSGSGLNYGRVAYEALINQYGTHMGSAYSALHYTLGGKFADANAQGNAQVVSLWAKHPLIRSRDLNLYTQAKFDYMQLNDQQLTIKTYRHSNSGLFNISGDANDTFFTAGMNTWDVGITAGSVVFDDAGALVFDASQANTNGSFTKVNLNLTRLQNLSQNNSLYISVTAQAAGNNLDTSQKMTVGGPNTVRAYDTSSVSGDNGYLLSTELRHDLGTILSGRIQVLGFIDTAEVTINKNAWSIADNSARLSGVGVGLNWVGKYDINAKTYLATPVGAKPSQVLNNSTCIWLEVGKRF